MNFILNTIRFRLYVFAIIGAIGFPGSAFAQLVDNFDDGDFTNNPTWMGDVDDFIVNASGELQLMAPQAGSSSLYTDVVFPDSIVWSFEFRMAFAPSGSNLLRIILMADSQDIPNANGYFIEIGESGSDDRIRIFRQDNSGGIELLFEATAAALGADPALAGVSVKLNSDGIWELSADYSGGTDYTLEGTFSDDTYTNMDSGYFGFECLYTSTRTDKYFFDNILIQEPLPDLVPPIFLSVEPRSSTELLLGFSEALEKSSAEDPSNYTLSGLGNPFSALLEPPDNNMVRLNLSSPMASGEEYTLTVDGVADLAGNVLQNSSLVFSYLEIETANHFDVVISELMPDPSPPVGLPPFEYIELYNRSSKIINLEGMIIGAGSATTLPAYQLFPGAYVIICDEEAKTLFDPFGPTIGIDFPGLTNSGELVTLTTSDPLELHRVEYSDEWYRDSNKDEGGWSLELIDTDRICDGEVNWIASENINGGTPGGPNSVLISDPDNDGPQLISVFPLDEFSIEIEFDERLDEIAANNVSLYMISPSVPIAMAILQSSLSTILIELSSPLSPGTVYQLTINSTFADCLGNTNSGELNASFGLPEKPQDKEIVINEILFNPEVGGVDFVELFNRSQKVFSLEDLVIGNLSDGIDVRSMNEKKLFFPGDYIAVTPDPSDILSRYTVPEPQNLIESDLPSFGDLSGNCTLIYPDPSGPVVIDSFDYDATLHHPLLDDLDGVSLERVDPEAATQNGSNWHSASASAGYATPTGPNSQATSPGRMDGRVTLTNKTFSPDGDGFKDFLLVGIHPENPGSAINIKIFDARGRLVRNLTRNELAGLDNIYKWDGTNNDEELARMGIYVLYIEILEISGNTGRYKETCVLARKL